MNADSVVETEFASEERTSPGEDNVFLCQNRRQLVVPGVTTANQAPKKTLQLHTRASSLLQFRLSLVLTAESGIKRIALVILLCIAFWSGACGKKGDPRAPELVSPKTIDNLRAQASPSGVTLTWSRPSQSIDGRELKDLASFVIFRKEISPSCLECPVPYRQLTTVFVEDNEKFIKQRQYRFVDQEVRPQAVYRYRVSSQLSDGSLGGPSNEVEVKRGP